MKSAPFIAVEGPIGAGKTTLATMLSQELNLPLVKEIVEENPFLASFYQNIDEWSFQLEMFFLCNRFKQLEDTGAHYIQQNSPVISDYHIYKNMIFAERTLKGTKRDKYRQIYHLLTDDLPKPNLVIYIEAELDTLMYRINKRGRSFEQNMDPAYMKQLIADYKTGMDDLAKGENPPVILKINAEQLDFVQHPEHFRQIVNQVKELMI
ncbi:deoxynucleoside kinase [Paenibacillus silvae]|jgi:deoxyguanosine kinase|uniref:deoxynucleoside kinase n=1 Tax=Paenibacillus TaxID=44249 RepID=UPI0011A2ACA2|nr:MULTISPECIES: deoxynucleoside kinase [Paenibacillus]MBU5353261.1 deoxynucleoside kinase [Paenibacillus barcinonensis]MCK6078032.1 deoxynucleoside kinase [Paenibacillus silvae]MCK6152231.1 deoxynucleoside kinase [Paenibacillus silvae]MCK6270915.1 deoxynucleoside kinase [Paenibacillus silvae]MDM5279779.1 deoxynucleoside kinase [Paenibacillus silvae]